MSFLAYSYSDTATSNQTSGSSIPNMSCSFTLTGSADVAVQFSLLCYRFVGPFAGSDGESQLILYVDGNPYQPGGSTDNYVTLAQGENHIHQGNGSWVLSLGAGSHTIEMKWVDIIEAASTTIYYNRYLTVEKLVVAA